MMLAPALAAIALAAVHLWARYLGPRSSAPAGRWLSFAGGASVAYVFVHILPELARHQHVLVGTGFIAFLDHHVWLLALIGFSASYGIERVARRSAARRARPSAEPARAPRPRLDAEFWVHLGSFALYNALIGFLLLRRFERGAGSLVFFAVAMGLHMAVNDHGLWMHHRDRYRRYGRWLLASAVIAGAALAHVHQPAPTILAALFALLAGGIVLNVIKEELPEERESSWWAFAAGATLYSGLLLAGEQQ